MDCVVYRSGLPEIGTTVLRLPVSGKWEAPWVRHVPPETSGGGLLKGSSCSMTPRLCCIRAEQGELHFLQLARRHSYQ